MKGRVLVIDDEKNMVLVIQAMLERAGFEVLAFTDAREAVEVIESEAFDAIITDLYMPGQGGMEILSHARRHQPQVPVVMITAFGTVESAVSALKKGAFDFISKPFDQAELLAVIEKAVRTHGESEKEPAPLSEISGSTSEKTPFKKHSSEQRTAELEVAFLGESSVMKELRRTVDKVALVDSLLLLDGETGTGKELVAQEIHARSARSDKPFIKVNCAVIPLEWMESEIFGFEQGAFSGAVASRPGRFELAHEGTLFLDEVGELPLEAQAKLLRAIQDQEIERVGGFGKIQVSVRIIAACHGNLVKAVAQGTFREDLFHRLNVIRIPLPPLRERREDIPTLALHFIARFNEKFGRQVQRLDEEASQQISQYRWPGNIRQLENTLERLVLLSDSTEITLRDLPEEIFQEEGQPEGERSDGEKRRAPQASGMTFKAAVRLQTQAAERDLISKALSETGGNVTRAAEALGLSRKGLQLKMKELGLQR
ncbi:MAG: sigma-54-dependent Fis family transcriptional regulator [Cryobacterium sp.]|nr:sigma-54-dependent Fis family transcriptional regulator [Oligoflexia bacterium]